MATTFAYPPAAPGDAHDELHGHRIDDPYRWLEVPDAEASRAWSGAQDELWDSWAGVIGESRSRWQVRLRSLVPGMVGAPTVIGDRRFWVSRTPDQDHGVLRVTDRGGIRVLVDPNALSSDGTVVLDGWAPSLDGTLLAYQLSSGGDEESRLWILDVATGEYLDGPIDRTRYSPIAWVPGGEELYYVRRLDPSMVPVEEQAYHRRVYRHRIGTDPESDLEVFGAGCDKTAYFDVDVSPDGRWVAVSTSLGTAPRNEVHLAATDGETLHFEAVHEGVDAQAWGHFDHRGALWLLTDLDAPRKRLCRLALDDPAPGRPAVGGHRGALGSGSWEEVIAEDGEGGVLEGFALCGERLVVLKSRHAISEVSICQRADGASLRVVALPGLGSADLTARPDEGTDVWVGYTDHTTPYAVWHLDPSTGALSPEPPPDAIDGLADPAGVGDAGELRAAQVVASSADGTEIRATVVSGPGEGPRPTILYGYGGFDVALTPAYSPSIRAWVEAGGVWVVAHLRGGAEEGEAWHRDGMREHKHHVFEDFEAVADVLVSSGVTTCDMLGIFGGSNGGLLVGAALTRSPERYAAAVCSAPLLDMIRYERFGLGATWNDEFGTAADPVELGWLWDMSPYHHVMEGVAYPAVLFTVFDGDTRVDPLHARKMAAALQAATVSDPGDRPVLLRREAEVGHGARSTSRTVDLAADQLGFLGHQLGSRLPE